MRTDFQLTTEKRETAPTRKLPRHGLRRLTALLLCLCMVVGLLPAMTLTAQAGYPASSLPTNPGAPLSHGNVYNVSASISIRDSTGGNALTVNNGATVVINIPTGVTLTVYGGSGSSTTPGGAGIYVPSNSTLIITGGGTLYAYGGSAGSGQDGSRGGDGWKDHDGDGGPGGNGSGGSGGNGKDVPRAKDHTGGGSGSGGYSGTMYKSSTAYVPARGGSVVNTHSATDYAVTFDLNAAKNGKGEEGNTLTGINKFTVLPNRSHQYTDSFGNTYTTAAVTSNGAQNFTAHY